MVFGLGASERAVSAIASATDAQSAWSALLAANRALAAGEFTYADFVDDDGLDACERVAAQFGTDERMSKLLYSTALNARATGPALAGRPRLAAAVQRHAPALARYLDVNFEGSVSTSASIEAVVTQMAKSEFKDGRVGADGIALLKKAIDKGQALHVLNWHGDAAVMESLKRNPNDPRVRQNAFHFLVALKSVIDHSSDSRMKTGFAEAGIVTANNLMRSWPENLEKQTGVVYAPCALTFTEDHSYFREPARSRGVASDSCLPWSQPPPRQRFIENILISAGMAAGTSALFQVFMGQRINPLGLIPAAMGGAGGAIGGAIGGELGGPIAAMGGAMVGGAGGAAIGAHALNAAAAPKPPKPQPMPAQPVMAQPAMGYPVGPQYGAGGYPPGAVNPYPTSPVGGYYPMGQAPPPGYPQAPPAGYPPGYRDAGDAVAAKGLPAFAAKASTWCF